MRETSTAWTCASLQAKVLRKRKGEHKSKDILGNIGCDNQGWFLAEWRQYFIMVKILGSENLEADQISAHGWKDRYTYCDTCMDLHSTLLWYWLLHNMGESQWTVLKGRSQIPKATRGLGLVLSGRALAEHMQALGSIPSTKEKERLYNFIYVAFLKSKNLRKGTY